MTYGYCRVSTLDQNNEKFQSEILKYCNNKDLGKVVWIEEKISGTKNWKNRELVCSELSRISRSVPQIWEIISICQSKNITTKVLVQCRKYFHKELRFLKYGTCALYFPF